MKNCKEIVRKRLIVFHFKRDAAEAEIQNFRAARRCFAEDGVGVGAAHGDAFGFALHGVVWPGLDTRRGHSDRCFGS